MSGDKKEKKEPKVLKQSEALRLPKLVTKPVGAEVRVEFPDPSALVKLDSAAFVKGGEKERKKALQRILKRLSGGEDE
ncbi:MAG: hypothetical protein D6732_24440 [Methanobacteriota archaeon]|nr:MAG: hypothetical protein D6732_24440 [Euryarchaeota archaeon]